MQLSLFPDEFEVQAAAVAALRSFDLTRARTFLDRVRRQNPRLVNVAIIGAALDLLESTRPLPVPRPGDLARALQAAHDGWRDGRISAATARFVDEVVAGYWHAHDTGAAFLDEEMRVHRGVVDLVRGDLRAARSGLEASLAAGLEQRGDLWGYLGDALLGLERAAEANACYVRALLLGADAIDLLRTKLRPLAEIHAELRQRVPAACARELILVHGWLQRVLDIPGANAWLDGHIARLELRARIPADAAPEQRCRRFAWLLYLDRSQPRRVGGIL